MDERTFPQTTIDHGVLRRVHVLATDMTMDLMGGKERTQEEEEGEVDAYNIVERGAELRSDHLNSSSVGTTGLP